jgi:hypothetical protein
MTYIGTQCRDVYGGKVANVSEPGDRVLSKACGRVLAKEANWDKRIWRLQDDKTEEGVEEDRAGCDRGREYAYDRQLRGRGQL